MSMTMPCYEDTMPACIWSIVEYVVSCAPDVCRDLQPETGVRLLIAEAGS